ncbi:MAG: hypothetical protein ACYTG7_04490 [Planctomycetota bacterium]|jgi:hypothetical protein
MVKYLTYPILWFFKWVFGAPPATPKSTSRKWIEGVLSISLLVYLFVFGPLSRFMPLVYGFEKIAGEKNSVFYQQGDEELAQEFLPTLDRSERQVFRFWNDTAGTGFPYGVDLFLCKTKQKYLHLIMNRARACATMGDVIMDMSFSAIEHNAFLRHELSHLYLTHKMGFFRHRLTVPAWLDEGMASIVQNSEWQTMKSLGDFLQRSPHLVPPSATPNLIFWLNAMHHAGSHGVKQYIFARHFTTYLLELYGREKVMDYLESGTFDEGVNERFERLFGRTLKEVENQWLAMMKQDGKIPEQTAYVEYPLNPFIPAKFAVALVVALILALWIFRQFFRLIRFGIAIVRPRHAD